MLRILFGGGLNENQNPDLLEANSGYNFELGMSQSKLIPRKPFDLKGTATNAGSINGILQLIKRDDTETTLVCADTTVYLWDGGSTFTSKGTVTSGSKLRDTYWSLGDYMVITDISKTTVVKKWDGTTFSTLTTGLGTNLYAKYGIVHLNRVWLFNVTTSSDTPHLMVASAFENPTSYDTSQRAVTGTFTTGLEAFYMLTPDLKPINGVALFHDVLIISTEKGGLYKLTGTGPSTFKWEDFYANSAAIGNESILNIGNDVIYMRQGGNIDKLLSTQNFGDVATDDVSRYIKTTVKDLTGALIVYDQSNQKVLFFVQNKVLVLFKDLMASPLSPWSVYTTQDVSNFNTNAARYMRVPGNTGYTVYFGDSTGRIFDFNGQGASGDAGSSDIKVLRKTRLITEADGIDLTNIILHGRVTYRRTGECDLTLDFDWADEYNVSEVVIALKGPPSSDNPWYFGGPNYFGGDIYFNSGFTFANKISSRGFSPTGKGPGFFLTASLETPVMFQVDHIDLNDTQIDARQAA